MIHRVEQGIPTTADQVEVGDTVYMGTYPVSSSHSRDPLEWCVLAKEEDKLLLISAYCIDWRPYHIGGSIAWARCDLRYHLQNMAEEMFTEQEREAILFTSVQTSRDLIQWEEEETAAMTTPDCGEVTEDQLFLLSVYEAAHYFADDEGRKCAGTPYAVEKGCFNNGEQNGACWWLRNCGYQASYAADVLPWGEICGTGEEVCEEGGIRPAMWVKFCAQ